MKRAIVPVNNGISRLVVQRIAVKRQPIIGSSKLIVNRDRVAQLVISVMTGAIPAPASYKIAINGKTT
jgi:hypothetical protein